MLDQLCNSFLTLDTIRLFGNTSQLPARSSIHMYSNVYSMWIPKPRTSTRRRSGGVLSAMFLWVLGILWLLAGYSRSPLPSYVWNKNQKHLRAVGAQAMSCYSAICVTWPPQTLNLKEEKRPHNIKDPPPYFTVGLRCFSVWLSFCLRQTHLWCLLAKSSIVVSSDHITRPHWKSQ